MLYRMYSPVLVCERYSVSQPWLQVYITVVNIKENSPLIPLENSFHLCHVTLVPCTQPCFFGVCAFEVHSGVSVHEISVFFHGGLVRASSFSEVHFSPHSPISLTLLSGILQSTNFRFPQWPSLFPPVSMRDICGAHSMYVRLLNEQSNLEFLCVRMQLRDLFLFYLFFSKSKPFLSDGPNTPIWGDDLLLK